MTSIPPRNVRFADTRRDRAWFQPDLRAPRHRRNLRDFGKRYSALFRALRRDERFAAFPLMRALETERHNTYIALSLGWRILEQHRDALSWDDAWVTSSHLPSAARVYAGAHPSLADPTKIACYPTRADAARKREVVMSAGKFFHSIFPDSDAKYVQHAAEQFISAGRPTVVFFIDNNSDMDEEALGDEWMRVYRNPRGFSSCMGGFRASPTHPARFYALPGNGLSLAYMTHDNTPRGDIVARAICHRERKAYVRCYGDGRLVCALQAQFGMGPNTDVLCDVECVAYDDCDSGLVAPYIDGDFSIRWDGGRTCKIVSSGGNYYAHETSGFACPCTRECDHCGDDCNEGDLEYSDYHDLQICSECRERHYTFAIYDRHSNWTWIEDDQVIEVRGRAYLEEAGVLESHGFVYSSYNEEWLDEDNAVRLEYRSDYVRLEDTVSLDIDNGDDTRALLEDTKIIVKGGTEYRVHEDYDGPEDDPEQPAEEAEHCAAIAA